MDEIPTRRRRLIRRPYCVHTGEPDHLQHTTIAGKFSALPHRHQPARKPDRWRPTPRIALHVRVRCTGAGLHHITEARAVARALRQAVEPDPRVSGAVQRAL